MSRTQTIRIPDDESTGAADSQRHSRLERVRTGGLEALAAIQAKLAAALRQSTSERLPAGNWLVICPEDLLGHIAAATRRVDGLMKELRRVREPVGAESSGDQLIARLGALCARFVVATGIRCESAIAPKHARFDAEVCDVVYWTVAELLTNVHKHARATTVQLTSGLLDGGFVFFRVADDGVGMTSPSTPSPPYGAGGLGLWSIEHRLSQLDSQLEIVSDRGSTVTIVLPPWLVVGG